MFRWGKVSLSARILVLVILGMALIIGFFSYFGITALRESTERALAERLVLAEQAAGSMDFFLEQMVFQAAIESGVRGIRIEKGDTAAATSLLREVRHRLPMDVEYLSLIDNDGTVRWTEPRLPTLIGSQQLSLPSVKKALESGAFTVSDISSDPVFLHPMVYFDLPLQGEKGGITGLVQVAVDPSQLNLGRFIQQAGLGRTGYAQVLDSKGAVLASTRLSTFPEVSEHLSWFTSLIEGKRSAVSPCHSCHRTAAGERRETEIITFAPLLKAPWGVAIRQSEEEALAPTRKLQQRLVILGSFSFLAVIVVALVTTESVRRPLKALTLSARRIAAGNLAEPVPPVGAAEIGVLANALDGMRQKLRESLEELKQRAEKLEESERSRGDLLRKLISAQEDERKRLARELHDETSQALTSLAISLETASAHASAEGKARLKEIQSLALRTLEEIHRMISDLRPTVLDDLGLIAALRWYAESRLEPAGIRWMVETVGQERRLPPEIETSLFRILQEAITNILRHAGAESTSIVLDFKEKAVSLQVEDDGRGFSMEEGLEKGAGKRGMGLLGMRERVELLGGRLEVHSRPGFGTQIRVEIPLER